MQVDRDQAVALGEVMVDLAQDASSVELRGHVGERLLRLLRADHFASYVWQPHEQRFGDRVIINMSPGNLDAYEAHFQFHDPITRPLQRFHRATFVEEVMPRARLKRTEFYQDFLARDGLHHGLNHFAWVCGHNLGDLRVWRSATRPDFTETDRRMLDLVGRAFTAALTRLATERTAKQADSSSGGPLRSLTPREREVAAAVAEGLTDEQIAARLGISFGTVRTHVGHVFDKLSLTSRSQLVKAIWSHSRV